MALLLLDEMTAMVRARRHTDPFGHVPADQPLDNRGRHNHCLRHTAACAWILRGVPLTTVQAWLGRGSIEVTARSPRTSGTPPTVPHCSCSTAQPAVR